VYLMAQMASLVLHPVFGAVGGWIGAHQLPAIPLPPISQSRARASTSDVLFVLAVVSAIAVLYTSAMSRLWLVAALVTLSWGYGAYVWLTAADHSQRWCAVAVAGLGALLALTTWQTPEPPPRNPAASFGLLVGAVSGALLIWRIRLSDAK
jgi:hypothetical protein